MYQYYQLDENDDGDIYYRNTPTIGNSEDLQANLIGNEMVATSYDNNFNLVTRNYTNEHDYKKVRYYWNNKKTKVAELGILSQFTQTTSLTFGNIDDSLFEPSTRIQINGSSYSSANGPYSIIFKYFVYSSSNFKTYTNTVSLYISK